MDETTIAVVPEAHVIDEAYADGYNRFQDADEPAAGDTLEAVDQFTETPEWANTVAPHLRALSGYVDSGSGTYTIERDVVLIPRGMQADIPRNGRQVSVDWLCDRVIHAWRTGALDALDGNCRGENLPESL